MFRFPVRTAKSRIRSKIPGSMHRHRLSGDGSSTRPDGSKIRLVFCWQNLRPHPPHGVEHSIGRVNPIQIPSDLGAQKSASHNHANSGMHTLLHGS